MGERAVDAISERIAALLREDLCELLADIEVPRPARAVLTVAEVAGRLGVTRPTVYAHWREWGGYRLGRGTRAPIRFDPERLPSPLPNPAGDAPAARRRAGERDHRRLIADEPRFSQPFSEGRA